jgi:hypothetical protein
MSLLRMQCSLILALAVGLSKPVGAQEDLNPEFGPDDMVAVQQLENDFARAFWNKDFAASIDMVPPPILDRIIADNNLDPATFRSMQLEQLENVADQIEIKSFDVVTETMTTGFTMTGRAYAMAPTQLIVTLANGFELELPSQTLFFEDNNVWFILRLDQPGQIDMLKAVYPEFTGIDLGEAP